MSTEEEIYKPVNYEDFGNFYEVSNFGNVRLVGTKQILKLWSNNGYMTVKFKEPRSYNATVSRMVAYTFVNNPNPELNKTVNHIDEDKHNNYYKNLEWITQKENIQKSSKDTTHKKRVIKTDNNGNIIKVFDSINEACKEVGVDRTTISKVIVGVNQTAGGFKWEYEDEEKRPQNKEDVFLEEGKCLRDIDKILENYYVFKNGRVYNKSSKIFLKNVINDKGANYVTLPKENGKKNYYVQQLVALMYIPNPHNKKRVKHIDGNKNNNSVDNLLWF